MAEENAPKKPSTKDFRILVVDDEEEVCRAIAQVVAKRGYRAALTTSGLSAIRQYAKQPFDLVLAGLAMPDMNGWQVLESLKGLKDPLKVVIVTGMFRKRSNSSCSNSTSDDPRNRSASSMIQRS